MRLEKRGRFSLGRASKERAHKARGAFLAWRRAGLQGRRAFAAWKRDKPLSPGGLKVRGAFEAEDGPDGMQQAPPTGNTSLTL